MISDARLAELVAEVLAGETRPASFAATGAEAYHREQARRAGQTEAEYLAGFPDASDVADDDEVREAYEAVQRRSGRMR